MSYRRRFLYWPRQEGKVSTSSAESPRRRSGTGRTCSVVADDYDAALADAQVCNVAAANACDVSVPDKLGCNPCEVPVQDDTKLAVLQKEWNALGCKSSLICPAIVVKCAYPVGRVGYCKSSLTVDPGPVAAAAAPIKVKGTCAWEAGGILQN